MYRVGHPKTGSLVDYSGISYPTVVANRSKKLNSQHLTSNTKLSDLITNYNNEVNIIGEHLNLMITNCIIL